MNPVLRQSRLFDKIGPDSANGSPWRGMEIDPGTNDNGVRHSAPQTLSIQHPRRLPTTGQPQPVARLERLVVAADALETLGDPAIRIVLWERRGNRLRDPAGQFHAPHSRSRHALGG